MPSARALRAGKAVIELSFLDNTQKGLRRLEGRLKSIGSAFKKLGARGMIAGGAILSGFAVPTKIFSDFDDTMRMVGAISRANGDELGRLTEKAKELGRTTSFTAAEVGGLMTELARAGFSPDEIVDMTASVLNLSKATGTDATLSAGVMSAAMRIFGYDAASASRAADNLTLAANGSFNSVESLSEALKYAGPVAADMGMSMEETLAILGGLGNLGIQGSMAGNAVKRLATLTAAEADRMQEIFGVAFKDSAGNALPLIDVLEKTRESTAGLGTAARAQKYNEAFGLLGITGASAIGKNAVDIRKLLDTIKNGGGAAAKTAEDMEAGLGGSFRKMWSAIEGVALAIGKAVEGPIQSMADTISSISGMITYFVEQNQWLLTTMLAVGGALLAGGAALVAIGVSFSVIASAVGGLATLIGFIGPAFAAIVSPIGITTVALGGLATWFLTATESGRTMVNNLTGWLQGLGAIVGTTFKAMGAAIAAGDMSLAAEVLWAGLQVLWLEGTGKLRNVWTTLLTSMQKLYAEAVTGLAMLMVSGWEGMKRTWTSSIEFMLNAFTRFTGMIQKAWNNTVAFFKLTWQRIKEFFGADVGDEIRKINEELDIANAEVDRRVNATITDRSARADASRAQSRSNEQGAIDILAQDLISQLAALDAGEDAALAAARDKAAAAMERFRAATEKAEIAQQKVEEAKKAEAVKPVVAQEAIAAGAAAAVAKAPTGAAQTGVFDARLAGQMFGGQRSEELDALKKIVKNTSRRPGDEPGLNAV